MQKKYITSILAALVLIFSLTYILSFVKNDSSKDKRKPFKTTLVNPKNALNIQSFEISNGNSSIYLAKANDFWIVFSSEQINPIPADTQRITQFIDDLIQTRILYKVSDKPSKDDSFGLQDDSTVKIKYTLKDSTVNELYFGCQNFAQTARYLMTAKSLSVYEIDNSLEKYLSLKVQAWSDPYIISRAVMNNISPEDFQGIKINYQNEDKMYDTKYKDFLDISAKLLELRHGGIGKQDDIENASAEMQLFIQLGNKSNIIMTFYACESVEREYVVKVQYIDELKNSNNTFYSKISLWTYNKIKEIIL